MRGFASGEALVFLCLVIALLTSAAAYIFAAKNNFSAALLPAVYPVAGAAIASAYFLLKVTLVDAPPPTSLNTTVAMLQERKSGMLYSMSNIYTGDAASVRSPLFWIDVKGQSQDLLKPLKEDLSKSPEKENATKLDILEYAVLMWLQELEQRFGYQSSGFIEGFSGGGGGGNFDPKATVEVPLIIEGKPNPLIQDLKFSFPPGSKIIRRSDPNKWTREIELTTKYSRLLIKLPTGATMEALESGISPVAKKIVRRMKLEAFEKTLSLNVFRIEFHISQNRVTRFGTNATRELIWLAGISNGLAREFSWVALKSRIAAAPELPKPS